MTLNCPAYKTSIETEPFSGVYRYDVRGVLHDSAPVLDRASSGKRSSRTASEPIAMEVRDGFASFPGRPMLAPLPMRHGGAELVAVVDLLGRRGRAQYRDPFAQYRCACGKDARCSTNRWRTGEQTQCSACVKKTVRERYHNTFKLPKRAEPASILAPMDQHRRMA